MTILNSKFDIIGRDPHPNALAGLLVVLPVYNAPGIQSNGTPTAGSIVAGSIVAMNSSGQAVPGDGATALIGDYPSLLFTAVDGDADFDGAFVHRVTCIQGGAEFQLSLADNVNGTSFTPGQPMTVCKTTNLGKWELADATGDQIYGFVGQDGVDTVKGILNVIVPQGLSPAVP